MSFEQACCGVIWALSLGPAFSSGLIFYLGITFDLGPMPFPGQPSTMGSRSTLWSEGGCHVLPAQISQTTSWLSRSTCHVLPRAQPHVLPVTFIHNYWKMPWISPIPILQRTLRSNLPRAKFLGHVLHNWAGTAKMMLSRSSPNRPPSPPPSLLAWDWIAKPLPSPQMLVPRSPQTCFLS